MAGTVYIDPEQVERKTFDRLDRVQKRDLQDHIVSDPSTDVYRERYELINWGES